MTKATVTAGRRARTRTSDGDPSTRRQVIDAAVASILERGFYRTSSNEIARRAGVTWGVIQYHFGTREALMLAVLQDGAGRFIELVENARIEGVTTQDRLDQLLQLLVSHYGTPEYLAYLQIQLNMDHDPTTSTEVRRTLRMVSERSNGHVRRLLGEVLGPAADQTDLVTTLFVVLRGFAVSQQLLATMAYDAFPPEQSRAARQQALLTQMLVPYLERVASEAG